MHAVVVVLYVVLKAVPIGKRELIGTAYHWGLSFNGEDNARGLLQLGGALIVPRVPAFKTSKHRSCDESLLEF